jgi:hypothetical protein
VLEALDPLVPPPPPKLPWNDDDPDPSKAPLMPKANMKPIRWLLDFAISRGYLESVQSELDLASNEIAPVLGEISRTGADADADADVDVDTDADTGADADAGEDELYGFSQPPTPSQSGFESSQPDSQSSYASARSHDSTGSFYSARSTIAAAEEEALSPVEEEALSPLPNIGYHDMIKEDNSFKYSGSYNFTQLRRHGWGNMTWNRAWKSGNNINDQWIDGDRYHGYWHHGLMDGPAFLVEYNENGGYIGTYVGMYHEGFRTIGTYFWADGIVYEGRWDEGDNMNGTGKMWSPTESGYDVYMGNYENRDKMGEGTYYWDNRDTFKGIWNIDKVSGVMRYNDSGYIYHGTWGKPEIGSGGSEDKMLVCDVYGPDKDHKLKHIGTLIQWNYTTVDDQDMHYMIYAQDGSRNRVYIDIEGVCNVIDEEDGVPPPSPPPSESQSSGFGSQLSSASFRSEADIAPITWSRRHPRRVYRMGVQRPISWGEGGGTRKKRGKSKNKDKGKGTHKKKQTGTRKNKGRSRSKGKHKGTRKRKGKL